MGWTVGVDDAPRYRVACHQLFGLPLQLALYRRRGLYRRFKTSLRLLVTQVNKRRIQLWRDFIGARETIPHGPRHTHHATNELHGKVHIVHRLGTGQHKGARSIKARASRLLEDQHALAGVIGNGSHQHRIRLV